MTEVEQPAQNGIDLPDDENVIRPADIEQVRLHFNYFKISISKIKHLSGHERNGTPETR